MRDQAEESPEGAESMGERGGVGSYSSEGRSVEEKEEGMSPSGLGGEGEDERGSPVDKRVDKKFRGEKDFVSPGIN